MQWITTLARRTSGWTGADLAGLVRSAASFAMQRQQKYMEAVRERGGVSGLGDTLMRKGGVVLQWGDFEKAYKEMVKPKLSRLVAAKELLKIGIQHVNRFVNSNNSTAKADINRLTPES